MVILGSILWEIIFYFFLLQICLYTLTCNGPFLSIG